MNDSDIQLLGFSKATQDLLKVTQVPLGVQGGEQITSEAFIEIWLDTRERCTFIYQTGTHVLKLQT